MGLKVGFCTSIGAATWHRVIRQHFPLPPLTHTQVKPTPTIPTPIKMGWASLPFFIPSQPAFLGQIPGPILGLPIILMKLFFSYGDCFLAPISAHFLGNFWAIWIFILFNFLFSETFMGLFSWFFHLHFNFQPSKPIILNKSRSFDF